MTRHIFYLVCLKFTSSQHSCMNVSGLSQDHMMQIRQIMCYCVHGLLVCHATVKINDTTDAKIWSPPARYSFIWWCRCVYNHLLTLFIWTREILTFILKHPLNYYIFFLALTSLWHIQPCHCSGVQTFFRSKVFVQRRGNKMSAARKHLIKAWRWDRSCKSPGFYCLQ